MLQLQAGERQVQSTSHHWQVKDINQFQIRLQVWNGSAYVDLSPAMVATVSALTAAWPAVRFTSLQPSLYQASVTALGNAGGTAPTTALNATPATSSFDFRSTPDVDDWASQRLAIALDPVTFASTVSLNPQNVSAQASTLTCDLRDSAGTLRYTTTYPKAQKLTLRNLQMGVAYTVTLTQKKGNGSTLTSATGSFSFDPTGQDLADITLNLTL